MRLIVLRLLCDLTALQCKLALTDLCSCRHYEAIHPHSSQMKHLKEKYSQSFFGYTSIDHRSAVLHSYEPVQVLERPRSHGWDPPRSLDRHLAQPLSDPGEPEAPPSCPSASVSSGGVSREPLTDSHGSLLRVEVENRVISCVWSLGSHYRAGWGSMLHPPRWV